MDMLWDMLWQEGHCGCRGLLLFQFHRHEDASLLLGEDESGACVYYGLQFALVKCMQLSQFVCGITEVC